MQRRRLLIVGCGDVVKRALPWLKARFAVYALARTAETATALRTLGITPIAGDLDHPASLRRLRGLADYVLHSAPPPTAGEDDPRTRHLLAALSGAGILPRGVVYISTTGVYGNCDGARISETQPCRPDSERAARRMAAERRLRRFGRLHSRIAILRAPGIYAADRLPTDRIHRGSPALVADEDAYSNHIHADDLAHIAALALWRGRPNRTYNVCDDAEWKMGEWFDRVADAYGLNRPPRLPRAVIQQQVSPALWSFMRESRRLKNQRMKQELRIRLHHLTAEGVLSHIAASNR